MIKKKEEEINNLKAELERHKEIIEDQQIEIVKLEEKLVEARKVIEFYAEAGRPRKRRRSDGHMVSAWAIDRGFTANRFLKGKKFLEEK